MENSSLLYQPVSNLAPTIIPGLEKINLSNMAENALRDEAIERIEESRPEEERLSILSRKHVLCGSSLHRQFP